MTATMTQILSLTESLLEVQFSTDMEETEVSIETDDGDATVFFAPVRFAPPIATPETVASKVEALWTQHGYAVRSSTEEASQSLIIDGYTPRGGMLTCQFSPFVTILTGESEPTTVADNS